MRISKIFQGATKDTSFQLIFVLAWAGGFFGLFTALQNYNTLPEDIPIYFYQALGERLAPKNNLWILIGTLFALLAINTLIIIIKRKDRLFVHILIILTLILIFFGLLALNQIISIAAP